MRVLALAILLMMGVFGFWQTAEAATARSLVINRVSASGRTCANLTIELYLMHVVGTTNDYANNYPNHHLDDLVIVVFDGNGNPIAYGGVTLGGLNTWDYLGLTAMRYDVSLPTASARPFVAVAYDVVEGDITGGGSVYHSIWTQRPIMAVSAPFDPSPISTACAHLPWSNKVLEMFGNFHSFVGDGRLNAYDTLGAVYADKTGIFVYAIGADSRGTLSIYVTANDLDKLPEHPDKNTLLVQSEDRKFAIYKLTTGEYQVNVGPDKDGKVQEIIFTGLPPTNVYRHEFFVP